MVWWKMQTEVKSNNIEHYTSAPVFNNYLKLSFMDTCITLVYFHWFMCFALCIKFNRQKNVSTVFFAGVEKEIHTVIDLSLPVHWNLKICIYPAMAQRCSKYCTLSHGLIARLLQHYTFIHMIVVKPSFNGQYNNLWQYITLCPQAIYTYRIC